MLPVESFEDNIKQESPFQSEISSEMPAFEQDSHSSYTSSGYDQRNLGYANNFSALPNDFTTFSSGNHTGQMSNASFYNPAAKDIDSGTGIVIRQRRTPNHSIVQNTVTHGTAPKRIHLQMKLQVGSAQCSRPKEPTNSRTTQEGEPAQVRCFSHLCLEPPYSLPTTLSSFWYPLSHSVWLYFRVKRLITLLLMNRWLQLLTRQIQMEAQMIQQAQIQRPNQI